MAALAALLAFVAVGNEFVAAHNEWRRKVSSPPLQWSDALAARAGRWAHHLIVTGEYTPNRDGKSGENLYEIVNGHAAPRDVVNAWASESAHYNPNDNSCSARCGHYLQVVWHDTRLVGCASAQSGRREVWVCDYTPPGNIAGEKPY